MKKFLIIGNKNAITYKEIFPYIKNNQLWLGLNSPSKFSIPGGEITKAIIGLCRWFTNIENKNRKIPPLELTKEFSIKDYPLYDNYLAFNVNRTKNIPKDEYIEIEIDPKDYPKWKAVYGDDVEIIEDDENKN